MNRETFEGEPIVPVGDSRDEDSLKEFSISRVIACKVAGLGRILTDDPSFMFNLLLDVSVADDVETVRLLVVVRVDVEG